MISAAPISSCVAKRTVHAAQLLNLINQKRDALSESDGARRVILGPCERLLFHLGKRADSRGIDGVPFYSEHRAVAGAIPARLKAVPVQVAANMGAACRVQVQGSCFVAVCRNLCQTTSYDPALSGLQIIQ